MPRSQKIKPYKTLTTPWVSPIRLGSLAPFKGSPGLKQIYKNLTRLGGPPGFVRFAPVRLVHSEGSQGLNLQTLQQSNALREAPGFVQIVQVHLGVSCRKINYNFQTRCMGAASVRAVRSGPLGPYGGPQD